MLMVLRSLYIFFPRGDVYSSTLAVLYYIMMYMISNGKGNCLCFLRMNTLAARVLKYLRASKGLAVDALTSIMTACTFIGPS